MQVFTDAHAPFLDVGIPVLRRRKVEVLPVDADVRLLDDAVHRSISQSQAAGLPRSSSALPSHQSFGSPW